MHHENMLVGSGHWSIFHKTFIKHLTSDAICFLYAHASKIRMKGNAHSLNLCHIFSFFSTYLVSVTVSEAFSLYTVSVTCT